MINGDVLEVDVPLHDWGCEEKHEDHPLCLVVWPDGRQDAVPTCCYEQGLSIDSLLEPFERVEWLPGLTVTDDSVDATMTLHQVGTDLYLLVLGGTEERYGGYEVFPGYETVTITAIRGSRQSALAAWERRVQEWVRDQWFDEVGEEEVAFLRWVVSRGFGSESAVAYREYLTENSAVDERGRASMIADLELRGYLFTFGGGLDDPVSPSTKADMLVVETLHMEGNQRE